MSNSSVFTSWVKCRAVQQARCNLSIMLTKCFLQSLLLSTTRYYSLLLATILYYSLHSLVLLYYSLLLYSQETNSDVTQKYCSGSKHGRANPNPDYCRKHFQSQGAFSLERNWKFFQLPAVHTLGCYYTHEIFLAKCFLRMDEMMRADQGW